MWNSDVPFNRFVVFDLSESPEIDILPLQLTLANQPDHCAGGGRGGGGQDSFPGLDLSGGSIHFNVLVGQLANVLPGLPAEDATLGEAAGKLTHSWTASKLSRDFCLLFFEVNIIL